MGWFHRVYTLFSPQVRQAVHFIHELGSLQYFDNELLKDRIVINPQWIVKVMTCIVSVHNKVITDGRLKHKDIGEHGRQWDMVKIFMRKRVT